MEELAGRLAALDPEAGAALKVVVYFDRLVEGRANLEAIVRGAAVLAGRPARLVDEARHLRIRVTAEGVRQDRTDPADPAWPCVTADGATLWLERPGASGPVDLMVLDRAAKAVMTTLERTRGRAAPADDAALIELVLDETASEPSRVHAAHRLGLRTDVPVRALALGGPGGKVEARVAEGRRFPGRTIPLRHPAGEGRRTGVGPAVPFSELPSSWRAARVAVRFAADGTDQDPGPSTVYADELGGLAVLAGAVGPETPPVADVEALERAGTTAPWMLRTLHAAAHAPSLRAAASDLTIHHSTLRDRLVHAERVLGWNVRETSGRLRLQLAFALRRLHRHP
ncbi:helix-turn-helix domain-containing protein [Thermopolyspora sp. NPDC052614]|uniref:helix-turn-helix domain-containing protein n=1 Tax=Thermopolyspora sp. NPDC052614 TaxID=3155682 RepID=UPI0034276A9F